MLNVSKKRITCKVTKIMETHDVWGGGEFESGKGMNGEGGFKIIRLIRRNKRGVINGR